MKKKISLILVSVVLVATIGIGARTVNEWVQVVIARNVNVDLNGETQTLRAGTGEVIYPIIYDGSSYLPVRAIAGLAGLNVDWDAESSTVLLGKDDSKEIQEYKAENKALRESASLLHLCHFIQMWRANIDITGRVNLYVKNNPDVGKGNYEAFKITRDHFYKNKDFIITTANEIIRNSDINSHRESAGKILKSVHLLEECINLQIDLFENIDHDKAMMKANKNLEILKLLTSIVDKTYAR